MPYSHYHYVYTAFLGANYKHKEDALLFRDVAVIVDFALGWVPII